jgi:hypothetical protein
MPSSDNPLPRWRLVREGARDAWRALRDATAGLYVPCAAEPDGWYPDEQDRKRIARAVEQCLTCPALSACRAYALANDERFGIWGGLSERERRAEVRRRQRERDKRPKGVAA